MAFYHLGSLFWLSPSVEIYAAKYLLIVLYIFFSSTPIMEKCPGTSE